MRSAQEVQELSLPSSEKIVPSQKLRSLQYTLHSNEKVLERKRKLGSSIKIGDHSYQGTAAACLYTLIAI